MADAATIGASFSDYQGSAALGGGNFDVVEINTKPLENLGIYTMLYNKEVWRQRQAETDSKVRQLADLSKIALNNLRGKDKEYLTKKFAQLQIDAVDYARKISKTPQERMENELKWQTQLGAFNNDYGSGKERAVSYYANKSSIEKEVSDADTKAEQLRQLDEVFDRTDITTPISAVPNYKTGSVDVPNPTIQKFQSIGIGANENVEMEVGYYNPKTNSGQTDAAILGIKKLYPKAGTPEFDLLSETEKNAAKIQATIESGGKVWVDATEPLNVALKSYVNSDGVFDSIGFENDNASNTTLMDAYNAVKNYDSYNRQKYEQAKTGVFNDKGLSIKTPPNLNPEDFKVGFVDFAKGVNANQLLQSGTFAKFTGDTFTKKLTETDNAIQRAELAYRYSALGVEREKLKKADTQDLIAADGILREVTDIINQGDVPENQVDVVDEKTGVKKRVFKIADPTILQKFGNVDKDGTTTNVPDEARYNPKTNEIDLVYFKRDKRDNIETTKTGRNIREIKPLNARTWANMVVQRSGSGAGRGEINEIVQSVITKNGGDLYKIAKGLNTNAAPTTTTTPEKASGGMTDAEFQEYLKKKGLK